jgi:cation-transporting ATPase F
VLEWSDGAPYRSLDHTMFHIGVFSNPWIWRCVSAMVGLQLLLTYAPAMNRLFRTEPIDGAAWMLILATALVVYLVVGGEKWLRRWWRAGRIQREANG